jgi:hypothetical protein
MVLGRRSLALCLLLSFNPVTASAQSPDALCNSLVNGRNGGLSMHECMCMHRAARWELDPDVQELVFDAWRRGDYGFDRLPPTHSRSNADVKEQLKKYARTAGKC